MAWKRLWVMMIDLMRKGIANYYDYIIVGSGIAGLYSAAINGNSGDLDIRNIRRV